MFKSILNYTLGFLLSLIAPTLMFFSLVFWISDLRRYLRMCAM